MARKRMINPDFFSDPELIANFDFAGRLFYEGLWCVAEDSGCFEPIMLGLKMKIFPGDNLDLNILQGYYDKFIEKKKIIEYQVNGKTFAYLTNFHKHQRLDRPAAPSIPLPSWIKWHGEAEFNNQRHKFYYEILTDLIQNNDLSTNCPRHNDDLSPLIEKKRIEKKRMEVNRKESGFADEKLPPTSKDIFSAFENAFGGRGFNDFELKQISLWIDENPSEFILLALEEAVLNGIYNFKYIDKILLAWQKNNLQTVQEVKKFQQKFHESKDKNHRRDEALKLLEDDEDDRERNKSPAEANLHGVP